MIKFKVTIYKRVFKKEGLIEGMFKPTQSSLVPVRNFYADDIDGVYDLLDVFAMEQHGLRNQRGLGHSSVKVFFKLKWEPESISNNWIQLKDGAYYSPQIEDLLLYGN